ncbi:Beta-chimaerin [Orchesella cincta]|uniref:Beta-chimaerin n=1 Tax=Orchesella cincta TaxID=48709 RepID=A0A1D2NBP7_ORCCI|nr:Beta-chimaerin [Orchesella cincta]
MCDLTQFNNQRNRQASNLRNGSRHRHHHQTPPPSSHSTVFTMAVNGRHNFKVSSNSSTISNHQQHSPSPSVSSLSRSSVERQRIPDLRSHSFQVHTFQELSKCQICQNFLWGLSSQGLLCNDCNLITHESCAERVITECEPQLSHIPQVFGTSLTILVKAAGGFRPPFLIEKCVAEIEKRGLHIEGIYRVSGSREQTERLKRYLEQERESADMSQFPDIHSMCSLVKLYFRILPQPLITPDVFQRFLNAGKGYKRIKLYLQSKQP